jgi:hypothetical protein
VALHPAVGAAMTEAPPRRKPRWSRGQIRFLAWVSGSAAFAAFLGVLGFAPKPAAAHDTAAAPPDRLPRQKIIVRKVIRRVVIVDPPVASYSSGSYGYVPSYPSGSSYSSGSSSGVTVAAPAPAPPPPPPPPVSSGGSTPPP